MSDTRSTSKVLSRIRHNGDRPAHTTRADLARVGYVNAKAQFEQSAVRTAEVVAELNRGASAPLPPRKAPVAHT